MNESVPVRTRSPHRVVVLANQVIRTGRPHCVGAVAEAPGTPTIEFVREDGVIRAVDITCVCGERIRFCCEYE